MFNKQSATLSSYDCLICVERVWRARAGPGRPTQRCIRTPTRAPSSSTAVNLYHRIFIHARVRSKSVVPLNSKPGRKYYAASSLSGTECAPEFINTSGTSAKKAHYECIRTPAHRRSSPPAVNE
ncbi:hypothetical protein EVAR_18638_1 [Eumeta japonica]|uniref:Uncharacterized protein n=1 Tax=Eumeta variegata TaxID=151549 RepID=A0A4C1U7D1_EUMVA|nr:hypothetical protein EVAR_18638_1 [Eumeta japonica]